jgi:hypothetical protein
MLRIIVLKERSQVLVVTGSRQIIGHNLNNIRCETSTYFRNKKGEYVKY